MRKAMTPLILLCFFFTGSGAQTNYLDSFRQLAGSGRDDTLKVQMLLTAGFFYSFSRPDSGIILARKALELSQKINYALGEAGSYHALGENLSQIGEYTEALNFGFRALTAYENLKNNDGIILANELIGTHYRDQGDYSQALHYLFKARNLVEALPDVRRSVLCVFQNPNNKH